jgi:predicted O-methyltransferase YrrM
LADALALFAMIKEHKPRRYIEVGCGHSSCAAIDVNDHHLERPMAMTFIDPNPELFFSFLEPHSPYRDKVVAKRVQDVPLDVFRELGNGDILFIDSSHVVKTGSDVVDYLFRILPALSPGALVHIHDIFFPFEYPREWVVDENRSWNEAYALRAFLRSGSDYRIIFFSDWIYKCRRDLMQEKIPLCVLHRGGSLWLQRRGRAE